VSDDTPFPLPPGAKQVHAVSTLSTHDTKAILSDPYFIHTAILPTLNVTLFDALVADLPHCDDALDSIRADAYHVNNIVQEISILTQNAEIHHAGFPGDDMIYRVSRCVERLLWI
jgi:hypothetical protein